MNASADLPSGSWPLDIECHHFIILSSFLRNSLLAFMRYCVMTTGWMINPNTWCLWWCMELFPYQCSRPHRDPNQSSSETLDLTPSWLSDPPASSPPLSYLSPSLLLSISHSQFDGLIPHDDISGQDEGLDVDDVCVAALRPHVQPFTLEGKVAERDPGERETEEERDR